MGRKHRLAMMLNRSLRRAGLEIVDRKHILPWCSLDAIFDLQNNSDDEMLRSDNPRLVELRDRYAQVDKRVTTPLIWQPNVISDIDLRRFRGSRAYLYQTRASNNPISYIATRQYLKTIDKYNLFQRFSEPGDFGVYYLEYGGEKFSRDLLDSINEIYFLDRHLGIMSGKVSRFLDIGAGYGRLASHLIASVPSGATYFCTDAIPVSTFLCEFYLRARGLADRVEVMPLDEVQANVEEVDVAINVHCFSECTLDAINWWLEAIVARNSRFIFVVPNAADTHGKILKNGKGEEFLSLILDAGYKLRVSEPKYLDPAIQEHGISPTHYHLFERC